MLSCLRVHTCCVCVGGGGRGVDQVPHASESTSFFASLSEALRKSCWLRYFLKGHKRGEVREVSPCQSCQLPARPRSSEQCNGLPHGARWPCLYRPSPAAAKARSFRPVPRLHVPEARARQCAVRVTTSVLMWVIFTERFQIY